MSCTVEQRTRVRRVAALLEHRPGVLATSIADPETGPQDAWILEVVLEGTEIPPIVLRTLATADLTLCPASTGTRGDPKQTVLVATV